MTNCFDDLINTLKTREKQLLRQLEAVNSQQLSVVQSNWELVDFMPSITVNLSEYNDLNEFIRKFGKIELPDKDNIVVNNTEPYKVEEYEDEKNDHISFDKSIKIHENTVVQCYDFKSKINRLTDINLSPINNSTSSSINDKNFIETTKNDLSLNSSDIKHNKSKIIGNNNCSSLCSSPLTTVCSKSSQYVSHRLNISNNDLCSNNTTIDTSMKINTSKDVIDEINKHSESDTNSNTSTEYSNNNDGQVNDEHPKQIQQWLQQILIETETEPSIQEIEQFAEISQSRYRDFQFSLET